MFHLLAQTCVQHISTSFSDEAAKPKPKAKTSPNPVRYDPNAYKTADIPSPVALPTYNHASFGQPEYGVSDF